MTDHRQLKPGTHALNVNGVEQYYHVAGNGPVCVVHPGGPGADWVYVSMPMLERAMTMVYLEPIGTGSSGRLPEHPAGYTISRYSQQLDGFLTALDLKEIFLLGQSHGGFVVQDYALAHPERLAGLILYSTSAVTGPQFMQAADAAVRRKAAGYSDAALAADVLRAWESVPRIADDASYTSAMRGLLPMYFADPHNPAISATRAALVFYHATGDSSPFDVRSALPSLKVPTLIIVGTNDFICGPAWADTIQASLPSAERVDFDRSGHLAHVEQPAEFAAAVMSFVDRHEPVRNKKTNSAAISRT